MKKTIGQLKSETFQIILLSFLFFSISLLLFVLIGFKFVSYLLAFFVYLLFFVLLYLKYINRSESIVDLIRSNYMLIGSCLIAVGYVLIIFLKSYTNLSAAPDYFRMITYLCIMLFYGITLFAYFCQKKDYSFEKLFIIQALVFGFGFLTVFPIYGVADEPKHLRTSYYVSNIIMNAPESEDGLYMRKDDADFDLDYLNYTLDDMDSLYHAISAPIRNDELILVKDDMDYSQTLEYTRRPEVLQGQLYQYLPQAVGITIARLLHLNTIITYLMGRLFNLLFYILIIYFAIKLVPAGKVLLYSIALLPMSLHLAASASRDAFRIVSLILIISLLLRLMYCETIGKEQKKLSVILIITCAMAFPIRRYSCFLYCLLPLFIFLIRRNILKLKYINIFTVISVILFLTYIGFKTVIFKQPIVQEHEVILMRNGFPAYTKEFFINNPVVLLQLLKNTIVKEGAWYITSMIGSSLGWLDVSFPDLFIIFFLIILTINTIPRDYENIEFSVPFRFYLSVINVVTIMISLVGMAITYTTFGFNVIEGFQGRYFLPILFPFLLCLRGKSYLATKGLDTVSICMQLVSMIFVLHSLILRFL